MMPRTLGIVLIAAALSATGGCGAPNKQTGPTGLAEAPDKAPPMTPAERSRRFQASYEKGLGLAEQEQYGLALGAFEEAVTLRPDSPAALFNLGACYEAIGDPAAAINIYRLNPRRKFRCGRRPRSARRR